MAEKKQVAVVLVDRANYGRMRPVMRELRDQGQLELLTVCAGTMLLDRFGRARDIVERDGFAVDAEVYLEVEGSVPITMTKSIGVAILEFSSVFQRLAPHFVFVTGDRYEALGAAVAAVFQNLCLLHLQGGEISGSIDELTRHAITKLAHYHFPATARAARYIEAMGEARSTIHAFGCPSRDVVDEAVSRGLDVDTLNRLGVGSAIDFSKPYLLALFHPVTTEGTQEAQTTELLEAVKSLGIQTLLLWPNIDAGSDLVGQTIRRFREFNPGFPLHAIKNLQPQTYLPVLRQAACCVGNSSSFVRETSFLGTPVVLVGSRQDGREWSPSVRRVEPRRQEIEAMVREQIEHGRYAASSIYGKPGVSARIATQIPLLEPYVQKRLDYIYRTHGEERVAQC